MKNKISISLPWATILVLVFAVLKTGGVLNISWWWVFSPFILAFGLGFIGLLILGIIAYISTRK